MLKRRVVSILISIIVICVVFVITIVVRNHRKGNFHNEINENTEQETQRDSFEEQDYSYILSVDTCKSLFQCMPDDAKDSFERSNWINGHYRSVKADKDNMVLVLSKSDINYWKAYINSFIKNRSDLDASEGDLFDVSDNYHKMVVYSKYEVYPAAVFNMTYILPLCGIYQMLNGENPDEWNVKIELYETESGRLVKEGVMQNGAKFSVGPQDWEEINIGSGN